MDHGTGQHDKDDNREGNPPRRLHIQERPVKGKPGQPENEVCPIHRLMTVILPQDEIIRKEDRRHGRKDRTDKIKEILEAIGIHSNSQDYAANAGNECQGFFRKARQEALAADAGRKASRKVVVTVDKRTMRMPMRPIPACSIIVAISSCPV